jgi:predicted ABC-type ATPase
VTKRRGRIVVAAGTNGAGKSVIAGEFLAARGGEYFNPDLVAKAMVEREGLTLERANSRAWQLGFEMLNQSIDRNEDFSFETTLGGNSICQALLRAVASGLALYILYVGLDSVERHIARVSARVSRGGHPIPGERIRERYPKSLANLIKLLPVAAEVRVYDNSDESAEGKPRARLAFSMSKHRIVRPRSIEQLLVEVPEWARPVAAAAIAIHQQRRSRKVRR